MNHRTIARIGGIIWLVAIVALFAPVAALWAIKLFAAVAGCAPGPQPCRALPLGPWFKASLDAALALDDPATVPLAFLLLLCGAGIAAGSVWRAVAGAVAPLVALILGVIGALSTTFPGCHVSEAGGEGCMLWGADLNHDFGLAGVMPWLLFLAVPATAIGVAVGSVAASAMRRRYDTPPAKAA